MKIERLLTLHPLNPLNEQEPVKYRWIASTSNSGEDNQEKGEQAKLVLKALIETKRSNNLNDVTNEFKDHFSKLNPGSVVAYMTTAKKLDINPDGCVGTALKNMGNYAAKWNGISTKELFTKYDVTNPYCSFDNKIEQDRQNQETILNVELKAPESLPEPEEQIVNTNYTASSLKISKELLGEKVTLINGKEVEVKKFLELLYNQNTKEFDFLLKMLPSDTSEVMKKEVTLKLAYDYFKDSKNFDETNAISERIGTSDIFEEYLGFNIDQFKSEEMNIMGGDQHSYLDFSA